MGLTERAIEMPRLVILGTLLLLGLGATAMLTLPKERTPRIKLPVIIVATPNPGATPHTNEQEILSKIEEEADSSLEGLKDEGAILGQAVNGAAIMQFVFDDGVDVEQAKSDVESLINRVKGQFPAEAQQDPGPIVNDIAFEDFPVIQVVIAGGESGTDRREIAEQLEARIEKVPGVSGVDIFGGLEKEIQVEINPHLMTLYGFGYPDLERAIRQANADAPSGAIESDRGDDRRVRSRTKLNSLEAISQVPLGTRDNKPVLLADVAKVYMGHEPLKSLARYNGSDAVVLLVRAKTDIDVLATANEIQELVDRFVSLGPAQGFQIGTVRSQAREIGYMMNQLLTSAGYGVILVVILLWISLGWRNAMLISASVPFALVGTSAIMWFARQVTTSDLTINNMTLFGMILVTGMVVDGCIIVGENIYRHRELGRLPLEAAKRGIEEVGGSLISAYLTTFAAFAPMLMIRGVMGDFMSQLPIVVLFALCSAMLVDHFLLPVLSMYVMKVPPAQLAEAQSKSQEQAALSPEQIEIDNAEQIVSRSKITRVYGRMLRYSLNHRLLVLALAAGTTAAPVGLFMIGAIGLDFFPDSDIPIIEVQFELPLGSNMEKRSAVVAAQIEQAVLRALRPDEWHYPTSRSEPARPVTTMGDPGALNTRPEIGTGTGPEFGMVYIELSLAEERERTASQIRQAIHDELPPLPGVVVHIKSPKEGPPVGAPIMVRVLGRTDSSVTVEQLAEQARRVHELLDELPGVYDVAMDYRLRPEMEVVPNRTVASLFDINTQQIARGVNFALEGVKVGDVDFGGSDEIDIRLRNQPGERDQLEDLANLPLRGDSGKIVTLAQVAQINPTQSANVINHYDQQRVVNVRAELEEGVLTDTVKEALIAGLRPDLTSAQQSAMRKDRSQDTLYSDGEISIEFGGETEYRDKAMEDLNIALMIAAGAMLIILTFKFNSFIQPLIVLFSVPLSLVGVSIGLMLCGLHFSIAAMIGVVALAGIVVNDAIVLVDFINRLRDTGVPMKQAVIYAGQLRLRPIILTTVTTISGLLPLGLNLAGGGEFFQPLTVTIMCGLGFATLLQLFIIPLACYSFDFRSSVFDPAKRATMSDQAAPAAA